MDSEKFLREIRIVVCTIFVGMLCARTATLPDLNITTDKANLTIDKVNSLVDSTHRAGTKLMKDYDDPQHPYDGFYYNIQNDLYNSQTASKHLDEMVIATNTNLNGPDGVFRGVSVLLTTLDTSVKEITTHVNGVVGDVSDTLKPLKVALENVDKLTDELAAEVAKGGNIDQTVVKLNKALDDIDTLIADPNIAKTIANGESITGHLDSTAKTLDDVMLPYRKKVGQVRFLIGKIIDLIKVTIKVW